jgi:hypothetical protein
MPQASEELRAMWGDDNEALTYLEGRGIKEPDRNGMLVIPNGFDLTDKDVAAIRYLMDEWDFAWRQIGNDGTNG